MTHRAAGRGRRIPRIWLLPLFVVAAITGATYVGILSRSLVLDLAAWWPVWLLVFILVLGARGRRIGKVRASGLVPLFATLALGLFTYGHVSGWPAMPSASRNLVGPEAEGTASAALSAKVDGKLVIDGSGEHLYTVTAIRRGGEVGMAEAIEQIQGSGVSVVLREGSNPGFYEFSGWEVGLSREPSWDLTLDGQVDADLVGLDISSLQVSGSGGVHLGGTVEAVPVNVSGEIILTVPTGVAARVVGHAIVPSDWEKLSDGWRSPPRGEGWVISVAAGSSLTINDGPTGR